jgi:hypothetical protein
LLALDGRTDGDVADLDVIRLFDGKGDGMRSGSDGEITPPEAMILMACALLRNFRCPCRG